MLVCVRDKKLKWTLPHDSLPLRYIFPSVACRNFELFEAALVNNWIMKYTTRYPWMHGRCCYHLPYSILSRRVQSTMKRGRSNMLTYTVYPKPQVMDGFLNIFCAHVYKSQDRIMVRFSRKWSVNKYHYIHKSENGCDVALTWRDYDYEIFQYR